MVLARPLSVRELKSEDNVVGALVADQDQLLAQALRPLAHAVGDEVDARDADGRMLALEVADRGCAVGQLRPALDLWDHPGTQQTYRHEDHAPVPVRLFGRLGLEIRLVRHAAATASAATLAAGGLGARDVVHGMGSMVHVCWSLSRAEVGSFHG